MHIENNGRTIYICHMHVESLERELDDQGTDLPSII